MSKSPFLNITKTDGGIVFLGDSSSKNTFEDAYINIRKKEGRIFSDEIVKALPYLPKQNPLYNEWLYRAITLNNFTKYLKSQKQHLNILDLGCGNGWFSARLKSEFPQIHIYAMDVNTHELYQAASVFSNQEITHVAGDIFEDIITPHAFDLIIMNSVIQYFPDIKLLINRLLDLITSNGEIHILDSPFYSSEEHKKDAQERSQIYFSKLVETNMIDHYHHHTYNSIAGFSTSILYKPQILKRRILNLLGKKSSPFPWIRIMK